MRPGLVALAAGWALLAGCTPTCRQVCRDLLECGVEGTETLSLDACEQACSDQDAQYESIKDNYDDEGPLQQFEDFRSCVHGATCEELEAGACYDYELFPF